MKNNLVDKNKNHLKIGRNKQPKITADKKKWTAEIT